ncbi:hypothetical protein SY88_02735 [Clostridiales bacterium PH28_bin88]|nr:hypothetical protein SY88_02735 [Clostridiales bacterium PH28_bin88]
MERQQFLLGVKSATPIVLGYLPLGFAYGVLARGADLTVAETVLMSIIVYAGSSQFIAVGLLAGSAPPLTIIFTTFLVNLRHMLMSASLVPYLRHIATPVLAVLAYEVTDETFAVASARYAEHPAHASYQLGLNVTAQVSWVTASWLGATVGNLLGDPERYGLDFALPAMFIALLVMQLKNRPTYLAALAGAVVSVVLARVMPGNWHIIIATVVAATVGVWSERWTQK